MDLATTHQNTHVLNGGGRRSWLRSARTIALLVLLQFPIAGYLVHGNSLAAQTGRELIYWGFTVILIGYITLLEDRSLASVHLCVPGWKSMLFGVAGAIVMVAGMAVIYIVIFPALGMSSVESGVTSVKALPVWFRVLLVIRAAVFEELYFRGFMIERLTEITGLRWIAAGISVAAFTFAHLSYWGWAHLIIAGFGGVILTGLYLWRRDLSCNMIAHLLTDAIGFFVA